MDSFRNHLEKNRVKINALLRMGCQNEEIIAIILVETFFRPPPKRIAEYFFYIACHIFNRKRMRTITLGCAQIQSQYWSRKITLESILSIPNSYDELEKLWITKDIMNLTFEKKIANHVGEIRSYYLCLANKAAGFIRQLQIESPKIYILKRGPCEI